MSHRPPSQKQTQLLVDLISNTTIDTGLPADTDDLARYDARQISAWIDRLKTGRRGLGNKLPAEKAEMQRKLNERGVPEQPITGAQ